jgi:3-methylfumaryl-CoA hydratase
MSSRPPSPFDTRDDISRQRAQKFLATLDQGDAPADGDPLPPLWHWAFFLDWSPTSDLGIDGHPRDGNFLPPVPHRRRMFGGGRVTLINPLSVGEEATRKSTILDKVVKSGRTGELLLVTVRHDYHENGVLRMTEEQDLVYRSDAGRSTPFATVTESLGPQTMPWNSTPSTTSALLFRFSALTGNAHRIHYDERYATEVEGFPALVVHGPLLAVYMAELARAHVGPIRTFDFRLTRPVFLGDAIRVQGGPDGNGSVSLAVVSGSGTVHATASATFA